MPLTTLVRQAIRHLIRRPVAALAFVCLTGVSLGAFVAAISSLRTVEQLAYRFPSPEAMVHVARVGSDDGVGRAISRLEFADWQAGSAAFAQLAGVALTPPPQPLDVVSDDGVVERLRPVSVTSAYFAVLGVSPVSGRVFADDDAQPGAARVVVLSQRAATALFGGAEAAVGRSVRIADAYQSPPSTVVGVVPDEAQLRLRVDHDVYVPIIVAPPGTVAATARFAIELEVIGRLRPGITLQEGERRLAAMVRQVADDHPILPGRGAIVSPLHAHEYGDVIEIYRYLVVASLAGVGVVVITLVGLALSTSAVRRAEFAVRRACGATRTQLHAQIAVETSLLTIAACGVTAIVSVAVASWLRISLPVDLALAVWAEPDGPSLVAGVAGMTLVAVAWWAVTSLVVIGPDARVATQLRRERWPWLDWTVGAHAALVLACLVPALVVVSGHRSLLSTPLGFNPERVTAANVRVAPMQLNPGAFQLFTTRLLEELRQHPNIERVALTSGVPLEELAYMGRVSAADDDASARVLFRYVTADYFATIGISMTAGRVFDDDASLCEVVLSNGFGTFGDLQPHIGYELNIGGTRCRVVGIAPPVREGAFRSPIAVVYRAFWSERLPASLWILATPRAGHVIPRAAIDAAVSAAGGDVSVEHTPLTSLVDRATAATRFYASVLSVASVGALGVVIASVFSLLSHAVRSRRRELAIRTALGGRWSHVGWTVARRITIGLTLGTVSGLFASDAILNILSSLSTVPAASGSWSWALAVGLLWLAATLAAAAPVISAIRTHPAAVLRDV